MIEDGASVYGCGDASRMAPDVRQAVATTHRERTGADVDGAARWLDGMTEQRRYLVDVWAAT